MLYAPKLEFCIIRLLEQDYNYIIASSWHESMVGYNMSWTLSVPMQRRKVFRQGTARVKLKTVSFKEEIMSKQKYPSIFSRQMEAIVFILIQIFFKQGRSIFLETFFENYLTSKQLCRCSKYYHSV